MVKPDGTGSPMRPISARFAPLPPSSGFIDPLPSVLRPNKYTYFAPLAPAVPLAPLAPAAPMAPLAPLAPVAPLPFVRRAAAVRDLVAVRSADALLVALVFPFDLRPSVFAIRMPTPFAE